MDKGLSRNDVTFLGGGGGSAKKWRKVIGGEGGGLVWSDVISGYQIFRASRDVIY